MKFVGLRVCVSVNSSHWRYVDMYLVPGILDSYSSLGGKWLLELTDHFTDLISFNRVGTRFSWVQMSASQFRNNLITISSIQPYDIKWECDQL